MKKNIYEKPEMMVVTLQHQHILCLSEFGMNTELQDTEVTGGWAPEISDIDIPDINIPDPEW
jgi:hypothetical protein